MATLFDVIKILFTLSLIKHLKFLKLRISKVTAICVRSLKWKLCLSLAILKIIANHIASCYQQLPFLVSGARTLQIAVVMVQ